jgi:RNA polymerase sigma-70 factor (ECF subfamily)
VSLLRRARGAPGPVAPDAADRDPLGELLRRAGRGDAAAFSELYDELAPFVHGVVRAVVRDPAQSEEVTQEVFVELWRLAARHDGTRGTVRSWAGTIAHRRAVDRVRSEQSLRDRTDREAAKRGIEPDAVAEQVETTMEMARLRRALERLTASQRESVELAYYGGHTYREVAVLLGLPEGTVKSRIRDALIRLRDELGATA